MKEDKERRSAWIKMRVTPDEKRLIESKASAQGQTVTDFLRQRALDYRLRQSPLEKERIRQLARIGANMNQIARWANTYKESLEAVEVLAALTNLETQIENFASSETGDAGEESILADESIPPRYGRWRSPCPLPHP
jgi:uncharacterized protein (DUF1778 family)